MSFMHAQRLLTLCSRLVLYLLLLFSFCTLDLIDLPFLSQAGSAALLALLCILPIGHASSFRYIAMATLTFFSVLCAGVELLMRHTGGYAIWRTISCHGWLPFILAGLYFLIGLFVAKHIRKKRYAVFTEHPLPASRLRIVQVADLHPWRFETLRETAHLYQMIDEENPDVLVLTGDIFDENTTQAIFKRYLAVFSALHPKYGIYFVYGNHDTQYHWKVPSHNKEDIEREFAAAGITILEDESITIAGNTIRILGRKDADEERLSPAELFAQEKPFDGFQILLCHEPVELKACAEAGADLSFAGHTHGGQIFPIGLISHRVLHLHDISAGRLDFDNHAAAIVTSGTGTWNYPIRTEAHSEIVIVDVYEQENAPDTQK